MGNEYQVDYVLLVDDDSVTNFINHHLLAKMQCCKNVKSTESIEEALQFIEDGYLLRENPNAWLIIMDINMPIMNGFEFLDELNSRSDLPIQEIDVIIHSSSINNIDTEKAKKYNILAFLDKPLTQEKLKAALGLRKRK